MFKITLHRFGDFQTPLSPLHRLYDLNNNAMDDSPPLAVCRIVGSLSDPIVVQAIASNEEAKASDIASWFIWILQVFDWLSLSYKACQLKELLVFNTEESVKLSIIQIQKCCCLDPKHICLCQRNVTPSPPFFIHQYGEQK